MYVVMSFIHSVFLAVNTLNYLSCKTLSEIVNSQQNVMFAGNLTLFRPLGGGGGGGLNGPLPGFFSTAQTPLNQSSPNFVTLIRIM